MRADFCEAKRSWAMCCSARRDLVMCNGIWDASPAHYWAASLFFFAFIKTWMDVNRYSRIIVPGICVWTGSGVVGLLERGFSSLFLGSGLPSLNWWMFWGRESITARDETLRCACITNRKPQQQKKKKLLATVFTLQISFGYGFILE